MTVFSVIIFERRNVRACRAHERVAHEGGNNTGRFAQAAAAYGPFHGYLKLARNCKFLFFCANGNFARDR
jgi:hypothetical protein